MLKTLNVSTAVGSSHYISTRVGVCVATISSSLLLIQGVIAASAGNHALGLSYHGQNLGVPVTVVMPDLAPLNKAAQKRP